MTRKLTAALAAGAVTASFSAIAGGPTDAAVVSSTCAGCHGANGISPMPTTPRLAGQYARMCNTDPGVTLVEASTEHASCPFSDEVLSGHRDRKSLALGYGPMARRGVTVVNDEATEVDGAKRSVKTRGGKGLDDDYLIVAPGIPKDRFARQGLLMAGWKHSYGDMVEWQSGAEGGKIGAVDARTLGVAIPRAACTNTGFSLTAPDYGISVGGVYPRSAEGTGLDVEGAGGASPADASPAARAREAACGLGWYRRITADTFG